MIGQTHSHRCCACGREFFCCWTDKECEEKGTGKAVKVNGDGPFCDRCRGKEMRKRIRELNAFIRYG